MSGCLKDVTLANLLFPDMTFEDVVSLYEQKGPEGNRARSRFDAGKKVYELRMESRAGVPIFENTSDVVSRKSYGQTLRFFECLGLVKELSESMSMFCLSKCPCISNPLPRIRAVF